MQHNIQPLILDLQGTTLDALVFIHDYLQMMFTPRDTETPRQDDYTLNLYVWPSLIGADGDLITDQVFGYRDRLCALIGKRVTEVKKDDLVIAMRFDDGTLLAMSLDESARKGPEAGQIINNYTREWDVW